MTQSSPDTREIAALRRENEALKLAVIKSSAEAAVARRRDVTMPVLAVPLLESVARISDVKGHARVEYRDSGGWYSADELLDRLAVRPETARLFNSNAVPDAPKKQTSAPLKNPFHKATWNITEQFKLMRSDPALAGRLKEAAEAKV